MGYRTFLFSVEEVLISSSFPSMRVQKSLMLGFFYFTDFCRFCSVTRTLPLRGATAEKVPGYARAMAQAPVPPML